MSTVFVLFSFVLCIKCALGQENIGDSCEVEEADDIPGICKEDYLCEYAERRINEERKGVTYCFVNETVTAVCCPEKTSHTGIFGRTFMESQDGKLVSNGIECRYTGVLPLVCCKRPPPDNSLIIQRRFSDICEGTSNKAACQACHEFTYPVENIAICPETNKVRIFSGVQITIEELPHMAVLGFRNSKKESNEDVDIVWVGGGTLISVIYILTAAHVINDPKFGNIEYAMLGTVNKTDVKSGILRYIDDRKRHNLYDPSAHPHDIALLKLDAPVPITKFTRPACLPLSGLIPEDIPKTLIVAGWGQVGQHQETSKVLLQGQVTTLSESTCRDAIRKQNKKWVPKTMICASSPKTDVCKGDSGGPLMGTFNGRSAVCGYYVVGIVSWGAVCGPNKVGVYTNVRNEDYLKWITDTVWHGVD